MILERIKAAVRLTRHIRTTGAINQSSRRCQIEMCSKLANTPHQIIVEFGAGPGNITREILSKIHESSTLYSFELNKEFCEQLQADIHDKRLILINDSAQNLAKYLDQPADAVISSLPLTIIPKDIREAIIAAAYNQLKSNAYFSQLQYSRVLQGIITNKFQDIERRTIWTFPMENVYHCRKT